MEILVMASIGALVNCGISARDAKNIAAQIGWCDIDEEWAYASATTITVPTGAASRFQVGDKIRLTQTTVKYFYVVGVADTVLTVTGGSDYTVDTVPNAAISSIAYSRCERPFGFPEWFAYSPSHVGFSANPGVVARFCLKGKLCTVSYYTGSPGTSNAATFRVSAPIAPTTTYGRASYGNAVAVDNGAACADSWCTVDGAGVAGYIQVMRTKPDATFTASGSKYAYFSIAYEVA